MSVELPKTVVFVWTDQLVDLVLGSDDDEDEDEDEDLAEFDVDAIVNGILNWPETLKIAIERACFADYLSLIEATDCVPRDLGAGQNPIVINSPEQVWQYIDVKSVRVEASDYQVVYAIPAWSYDLQHEWCIRGNERLIYVGQVLGYSADAYEDRSDNMAIDYDKTIARLQDLIPRSDE